MSSPWCDGFLRFARNDGKAYRPTIRPITFGAGARDGAVFRRQEAALLGEDHPAMRSRYVRREANICLLRLVYGGGRMAWMRDANTVAAIVNVVRQVHGDDLARVMLNDGFSLAIKLITGALSSGDFIVTPDFGSLSHLKYIYDHPKSLHVVDIAVLTLHGTVASTDIRLRLMPSDN
jgi:hypothetical protein